MLAIATVLLLGMIYFLMIVFPAISLDTYVFDFSNNFKCSKFTGVNLLAICSIPVCSSSSSPTDASGAVIGDSILDQVKVILFVGYVCSWFTALSFKYHFTILFHSSRPPSNSETYNAQNGGAVDLVKSTNFKAHLPTAFYIPGIGTNNTDYRMMAQSFNSRGGYNFISIEWSTESDAKVALPATVPVMRMQILAALDKLSIIFFIYIF